MCMIVNDYTMKLLGSGLSILQEIAMVMKNTILLFKYQSIGQNSVVHVFPSDAAIKNIREKE